MKYIKQEDETGCGVACIAMISGQSYKTIRSFLINNKVEGIEKRKTNFRLNHPQLLKVTKTVRLHILEKQRFSKWTDVPSKAIVSTDFDPKRRNWHWIVFDKTKTGRPYFFDPYERKGNGGKRRYDFRGKKCGHYYLVKKR